MGGGNWSRIVRIVEPETVANLAQTGRVVIEHLAFVEVWEPDPERESRVFVSLIVRSNMLWSCCSYLLHGRDVILPGV